MYSYVSYSLSLGRVQCTQLPPHHDHATRWSRFLRHHLVPPLILLACLSAFTISDFCPARTKSGRRSYAFIYYYPNCLGSCPGTASKRHTIIGTSLPARRKGEGRPWYAYTRTICCVLSRCSPPGFRYGWHHSRKVITWRGCDIPVARGPSLYILSCAPVCAFIHRGGLCIC